MIDSIREKPAVLLAKKTWQNKFRIDYSYIKRVRLFIKLYPNLILHDLLLNKVLLKYELWEYSCLMIKKISINID